MQWSLITFNWPFPRTNEGIRTIIDFSLDPLKILAKGILEPLLHDSRLRKFTRSTIYLARWTSPDLQFFDNINQYHLEYHSFIVVIIKFNKNFKTWILAEWIYATTFIRSREKEEERKGGEEEEEEERSCEQRIHLELVARRNKGVRHFFKRPAHEAPFYIPLNSGGACTYKAKHLRGTRCTGSEILFKTRVWVEDGRRIKIASHRLGRDLWARRGSQIHRYPPTFIVYANFTEDRSLFFLDEEKKVEPL